MNIGGFELGTGRTFVVAETCSNIIHHLDDLERCVSEIARANANALKVQLFRAEHFPERERNQKSDLEFPRRRLSELADLCHAYGLMFGASVFDNDAIDYAINSQCDFLKLATREWDNLPLFDLCVGTGLPLICSYDIGRWDDISPRDLGNPLVLTMACVPEYPAHNFKMPPDLMNEGWSSHTSGWLDCILAVSRRAVMIEKHIRFHPNDYEAGWSLSCQKFGDMMDDIRWVESVL